MDDSLKLRKWVMDNIIRPEYESRTLNGIIDKKTVTRVALTSVEDVPVVNDQFSDTARWQLMRDWVNDYHTEARRQRGTSFTSDMTFAQEDAQFTLPGLEDVRKDRVTIHVDGEEVAIQTWECDIDQIDMVLQDYGQRRDSLDTAMNFYRALRRELHRLNKRYVKELYEE